MTPQRILIVAPNWLGDAVMALPAIAALRAEWPAAALVVAGRRSTVPLFTMVPGVDEVLRLDSRGGLLGAISWAEDVAALRAARADLAILLPNSFRSAWTAHRAGIAERWGYAADLRGRLLTKVVPRLRRASAGRDVETVRGHSKFRVPSSEFRVRRAPFHQAEYYLHLVRALTRPGTAAATGEKSGVGQSSSFASAAPAATGGAPVATGATPVLPRIEAPADARERARQLLSSLDIPDDALLVGMAPGAAYGRAKQWPPERFAALAVDLNERHGAASLLFGARADRKASGVVSRIAGERSPEGQASRLSGQPVVDLAGRTDLPLLVALMARCRSVVSNDSGAMHVAAAAGVPVTAVFGSTDERGTAPLPCDVPGRAPHEILTSPAWCRPCMLRECPIDHRCMRRIEPATVAAAVGRQIAGRAAETED